LKYIICQIPVQAKKRGTHSPIEVEYKFFDSQDIKEGVADKNGQVAEVVEETRQEVKASPKITVEALTPEVTVNPTTVIVPEDKPRWVILNEWTKCSRSCGKGGYRRIFSEIFIMHWRISHY
jgi:hypothetical protein